MAGAPELDPLFLSFQLALAGQYSIEREIGRGGMGVVYLAREVRLDRPVAIKLLPPERAADERLRERFLREARLAAKLSHPNIIPIHAVDDAKGFVFYVMAFVDGETLAERVRSRGPLPPGEGTRIVREAAWALAHAHSHGLVHRDVKPDNILLERASGRALVADFGIAAATSDQRTTGGGTVAGTPEFMSPEQALGHELDPRSDIYSLGATAYYAFSGRLPFEGRTPTEVLAKHVTEPVPPLGTIGVSVPRRVALLVDRCMAKDPEHRPASADALAEQLGVALEQRRELPAALRAFVKRTGRAEGFLPLVAPNVVLIAAIGTGSQYGPMVGWGLFAAGLLAAPFAMMIGAARSLAKLDFEHQDLDPAFRDQVELSREEFASMTRRDETRAEKFLKMVTITTGPIALGLLGTVVWLSFQKPPYPFSFTTTLNLMFALGIPAAASLLGWMTLLQRRKDIDVEFYSRLWLSKIGKAAFAFAKRLVGKRQIGAAMTHRATELSLGLAAEQLYEALPRDQRAQLKDLPDTLSRLQGDAQTLRRNLEDLNEALNDAGDAGASVEFADVRATRDEIQAKLGDAVGALETIRLNLLRLHAGSGSIEGLTTHLGLAAEVSEGVARLVAAKAEVQKLLAFPNTTQPTPV
jgi:predicted Ser/Thr protein kinase